MDKIIVEDKHLLASDKDSGEIRICNRPFQQGTPLPTSPSQPVPTSPSHPMPTSTIDEDQPPQFEIEIEDNLTVGSTAVSQDACVRIYTPSLGALRDVMEHQPSFFSGKTIMWCHRTTQSEIDAAWFEHNEKGEMVLFNMRRNSRTGLWELMEQCPFGNLEFEDSDDLLQHARSWPIPQHHFRDYKLKFGAFTGLIRVFG